jgi:2-oxoglutarate dehydrogenase E2 component (dihydrolipoamide succinyltransferase)
MAQCILKIPKMGESVAEASIQKWLKKENDFIKKDEPFIEISTDKVDSEIPSPFEGVLKKIVKKEGDVVQINEMIGIIEVEGDQAQVEDSIELSSIKNTPIVKPTSHSLNKVTEFFGQSRNRKLRSNNKLISPLVMRIMREHGIHANELTLIEGTGSDGRITGADIKNYINNRDKYEQKFDPFEVEASTHSVKKKTSTNENLIEEGDIDVPFDKMRSLIAKHMKDSKSVSAHCTSFTEVDVTHLVSWRDEVKNLYKAKYNDNLTYTHLFMLLIVNSLQSFPKLNSWSSPNGFVQKKQINLGFATLLPNDLLIVPNIKNIGTMNLHGIVESVSKISQAARENKLSPEDIQKGTFTMSNTGIFGSLMGTPIINQPQVAIMSLGEILKTPAVVERNGEDIIEVRKKMILSLSYDHRIIDGAYAASFLKNYKQSIEQFKPPIEF